MATAERERLLHVLDMAECRRLLTTAAIGRIAFTEAAMPSIQPAAFAINGEDVVIPTGLGSKLTARTGWNVTVIGPSRLISDPSQVTALNALGVLPWAPAMTHCYIALHMAVVRGRRISPPA